MSLLRVIAGKKITGEAADIITRLVSETVAGTDQALVVQSVIQGRSTAGGGIFVDVKVSPAGAIQVGGTLDGITSIPLPPNASTEDTLQAVAALLDSINTQLASPALAAGAATAALQSEKLIVLQDIGVQATATAANQAAGLVVLESIDGKTPLLVGGRQPVDGSGVTQPISAVALPLPSGASTEARQAVANAALASIDGKIPALVSGRQPVDGSGVTQPISAAALPLPSGAATEASQATANASLASIDGKLNAPLAVSGPLTDAQLRAAAVPVSATALPLPAGAATSSNQAALIAALALAFPAFGRDAGQRLRTSQLTTLADLKVLGADDALLMENTGTGSATYGANKVNMSVAAGQYQIRRSYRYYPYYSGKSQVVELTFDNFQPESNVTKRVGYFSSDAVAPYDSNKDGFWLESADGVVTLKVARNGTEVLSLPQAEWNGDTLSGHSWSGFNVVVLQYLWLGGLQLQVFVKTATGFPCVHTFSYAGSGSADTFTLSPNHPVRYEIRSTTGSGSFRYICAQVSTEGSTDEAGKQFSVNTGVTGINLATIGKTYPMLGIRKAPGFRDVAVKVADLAGFVSSNTDVLLVTLQLNPTLSAGLTYSAVSNTAIQRAIGNGTITVTSPGTVIATAYLTQNSILPTGILDDDFLSFLGVSIADVSDQLVWCGTPITAGVTTFASMDIKQQ